MRFISGDVPHTRNQEKISNNTGQKLNQTFWKIMENNGTNYI